MNFNGKVTIQTKEKYVLSKDDTRVQSPKAVRSSLEITWRRCFKERIVQVCYRGLNLQMHTLFAVGPH